LRLIEHSSRAAPDVAATAHWLDGQRLVVVAMVVLDCRVTAIDTSVRGRGQQVASRNGLADSARNRHVRADADCAAIPAVQGRGHAVFDAFRARDADAGSTLATQLHDLARSKKVRSFSTVLVRGSAVSSLAILRSVWKGTPLCWPKAASSDQDSGARRCRISDRFMAKTLPYPVCLCKRRHAPAYRMRFVRRDTLCP